jgi:CPA2 family monovalent cation:H+ antiporter-2
VIVSPGSFAIGRRLVDMNLENFDVEVKSVRRPNSNGMVPTQESQLAEGDVIVLLGQPTGLTNAQNAMLIGRVANK